MYRNIFFVCTLLFFHSFCYAQNEWKLKTNRGNIKTYSKAVADSKINAVKIESVFPVSVSHFVSVILDIGSYDLWVYNSRSTRLLKKVSDAELYYYSEVDFPWPAIDRDFVSHLIVSQDPQTKTVSIRANNISGMVPENPGLVRIVRSVGIWLIVPVTKNMIRVEYELQVDPGGGLPAWLINPFASTGLIKTFENLRTRLLNPGFSPLPLSFIVD